MIVDIDGILKCGGSRSRRDRFQMGERVKGYQRGEIDKFAIVVADDELGHCLIGVMEWAIVVLANPSMLKDVQLR